MLRKDKLKKILKSFLLSFANINTYLWFVRNCGQRKDLGLKHVSKPIFFNLLARKGKILFVQIGANDGIKNDPIHVYVRKYHWNGLLVEPMPDFFNTLRINYMGEDQLWFENAG